MTEETLFELALKTPSAERAALLDRACEGAPELRERVEKLLAAHEARNTAVDGPLLMPSTADSPPQPEDRVDQTVGRYRLLQKLGEGGMGAVWAAEQTHPVKRRVALKLIKVGMDSARIVARFEAERQALAMMDHPCIAKVLDAGTAPDGRPFFAMELVKGVPITKYCDEVQATIRERLDLFVQTCGAVQHAHQKGIIHRDLKPSNILVAMHDGVAGPKVIDFGVAKALHSKLVEQTLYTEIGQVIGTLEYMAPEQAELSAMDIDTRADVYALGVLLFELLAGSTPITRERLKKAGYAEILRVIKEEEPPRPSTRLSASNESLPNLAACRRMEPKKLAAALVGELDWIALKALEKNRARRYETANALAADVRRYLADEPVEARPPSRGYRFAKFYRRNRVLVSAAGVVGLALVLGVFGTSWGLAKARIAEADAKEKLKDAETERSKAESARAAEAKQRESAERNLINGLLRPIGYGADQADPELRSLVDWSMLEPPSLKITVFERLFQDLNKAILTWDHSDRIVQACAGLSPKRRAQALAIVDRIQRDQNEVPGLRLAACRFALALGAADLPHFRQTADFAVFGIEDDDRAKWRSAELAEALQARPDDRYLSVLWESALVGLEEGKPRRTALRSIKLLWGLNGKGWPRPSQNSLRTTSFATTLSRILRDRESFADGEVVDVTARLFELFEGRLTLAEKRELTLAIIDWQRRTPKKWRSIPGFAAKVSGYLGDDDLDDRAFAMVRMLRFTPIGDSIAPMADDLVACAPRMTPATLAMLWTELFANSSFDESNDEVGHVSHVAAAIGPRLPAAEARKQCVSMLESLVSADYVPFRRALVNGVSSLTESMTPAVAADAFRDVCQAKLDASSAGIDHAEPAMALIARRLNGEAADALWAQLDKRVGGPLTLEMVDWYVIKAIGSHLSKETARRIIGACKQTFHEADGLDEDQAWLAANELVLLRDHLAPKDVHELVEGMRGGLTLNQDRRRNLSFDVLRNLAPRFEQEQVDHLVFDLTALLEKRGPGDDQNETDIVMLAGALAPRIRENDAKALAAQLLRLIRESSQSGSWISEYIVVYESLLPKLEGTAFSSLFDAYCKRLSEAKESWPLTLAEERLSRWLPKLTPAQKGQLAQGLAVAFPKQNSSDFHQCCKQAGLLAPALSSEQAETLANALLAAYSLDGSSPTPDERLIGALTVLARRLSASASERLLSRICPSIYSPKSLLSRDQQSRPSGEKSDKQRKLSDDYLAAPDKLVMNSPTSGNWLPVVKSLGARVDGATALRFLRSPQSRDEARLFCYLLVPGLTQALSESDAERVLDAVRGTTTKFPNDFLGSSLAALVRRAGQSSRLREFDYYLSQVESPSGKPAGDAIISAVIMMAATAGGEPNSQTAEGALRAVRLLLHRQGRLESVDNEFSDISDSIRRLAPHIQDPRGLAELLSHPTCTGKSQRVLLNRFEELTIHAGKPLPQPRAFHTVFAAAEWIAKNWPDFDLEKTCPYNWN